MKAPALTNPKRLCLFLAEATAVNCELMDHALRHELQRENLSITACALPSNEVLQLLKGHEADVALVSANLADGPLMGFTVLRQIRILWPGTSVVMLVDQPVRKMVIDAFRYGAHGIFQRNASFSALCRCIRAVAAGQVWANSEELRYLLEALAVVVPSRAAAANGTSILSQREETVVELVVQGLTNREVGASLDLSEHTVRNYVYRIYDKLGVSNRVELTASRLRSQHAEENATLRPRSASGQTC